MPWSRGRYYFRSKRQGGRVVNKYLGRGTLAQAAAALDTEERARRQAEAAHWRATRHELDDLNAQVAHCYEPIEPLAPAALVAAGYHPHDPRGLNRRRE